MSAMRASMVASTSSMHHRATRFSSPFDWQTISKWFCLPHALHFWPLQGISMAYHLIQLHHDGVYRSLYTHFSHGPFALASSSRSGCVLCPPLLICWHPQPARSETVDISFWSRMAISDSSAWLIFCSRVFSDPTFPPVGHHWQYPGWTGPWYIYGIGHGYNLGIWSHNPGQLIVAEIHNSERSRNRFERSMKMRSSVPWDLISTWLGPQAY